MQVEDQVGQLVIGGPQEDRALKGLIEQRSEDTHLTVDRSQ
jgi:hypothetical protein